ncbi:Similar to hypothetical protein [Tuber melanosporum Mel28]; acc. no. XP_002835895 [Pyronema omphalodes CBS 100304]|uniref:DUF7727 domain-containing protein n=1 Tax=Pyronema omphalodes (strain CBS 100304) TaxID=1076935 RepID=U4KV02_PYROM|nr:Similar to hypothetical protein [Tuber melanosporum Mel28]; acc. no. XP_002835895 [Pyronema omphalodes CBS 100304]
MGRLIKNHLARLIILTAATYQIAAGIHGIFWPKIFWDIFTKVLDPVVKPFPILQILNILFGLLGLAWEYPLPILVPNSSFHRSIGARLAIYPLSVFVAVLLYQGTNAAIYYLVGLVVYFWAYNEGEIVCMPWKIPERGRGVSKA